jgi:hypothetical protein
MSLLRTRFPSFQSGLENIVWDALLTYERLLSGSRNGIDEKPSGTLGAERIRHRPI